MKKVLVNLKKFWVFDAIDFICFCADFFYLFFFVFILFTL